MRKKKKKWLAKKSDDNNEHSQMSVWAKSQVRYRDA